MGCIQSANKKGQIFPNQGLNVHNLQAIQSIECENQVSQHGNSPANQLTARSEYVEEQLRPPVSQNEQSYEPPEEPIVPIENQQMTQKLEVEEKVSLEKSEINLDDPNKQFLTLQKEEEKSHEKLKAHRVNLIQLVKKKSSIKIESQLSSRIIKSDYLKKQNPKVNLLRILQKKQNEPIQIQINQQKPIRGLNIFCEEDYGNVAISPIYAQGDFDLQLQKCISSPVENKPTQSSSQHEKHHKPYFRNVPLLSPFDRPQNSQLEESSLQHSFVVEHEDLSKLDLDRYTLRVENMEVSYQQENTGGEASLFSEQSQTKGKPTANLLSPFLFESPVRKVKRNEKNEKNEQEDTLNQSALTPTYPIPSSNIQSVRKLQEIKIPKPETETRDIRLPSFCQDSSQFFHKQNTLQVATSRRPSRRNSGFPGHIPIETSVIEKSRDEKGNKKINNYIIMQEIGRGGFGKVRLIYQQDNHNYFAMKIANKSKLRKRFLARNKSAFSLLEQEIAILKKIDHPNVVKLYEVIDDPDQEKLYLIMEFVKKGSLGSKTYWEKELNKKLEDDDIPKVVSISRLRNYLRDFLLGLDYLHNFANIIHRDIKPDNLLIDADDHLKIADFGVAKMMEDNHDEIEGDQGTKSFLTPEHYEGKTVKGKSSDIWAIGVTFYLLAFGKQPFNGKNLETLKFNIVNSEVEYPEDCDPQFKDFLSKCLEKNPHKRSSLEQLMDHPFITNNGEFSFLDQECEELQISEKEISSAISKLTLRATVIITAKLKQKLNLSRLRLKSRTMLQEQQ